MKALFHTLTQLEKTMSYHRDRQSVLASNVANVETPGYRPMELVPSRLDERSPPLAVSNAAHYDAAPTLLEQGSLIVQDDSDPRPDGNTVGLEQQMARLNENRLRYTTSASLVSRRIALLRYAATDGNG